MAARAVQGIGSAASWVAALALVSDTAPPGRRGEALGVALGATSAGSIAGPALGGVTAQLLSFEAPFLIFCGLALALLVATLVVLPRETPRTTSAAPALPAIIRATRSGFGAWAAAIILASSCVLGLVEVVAPLDLDARLGLSSSAIGLLFAASIAVDAALSPFGGRWGDRRGRRGPAVVGLAATGVSMLALAVLPGVGGTAVALGIYGAGFSLMMAASVPWLDEAFPGRRAGARLRGPEPALRRRLRDRSDSRRRAARGRQRGSRLRADRSRARGRHGRARGHQPTPASADAGVAAGKRIGWRRDDAG